jgi:hypothetical protein
LLDDLTDPDMLLGLRHAYAGEVAVLDRCLGMLLDSIEGSEWRHSLFGVTSCRGYPLGEHGVVGDACEALYAELVRVPFCLRVPGGPKYGFRSQALVQPADYFATLWDWFSPRSADNGVSRLASHGRSLIDFEPLADSTRKLAIARSHTGEVALATPAWYIRAPALGQKHGPTEDLQDDARERPIELFAEPDDYFQVNEVSDRCLEVVDEFRQVLQAVETAIERSGPLDLALSDALLHSETAGTR